MQAALGRAELSWPPDLLVGVSQRLGDLGRGCGQQKDAQISRWGELRVVGGLGCGPSCGRLQPFSVELGAGKLSLGFEVSYAFFILLLQRAHGQTQGMEAGRRPI